MSSRIWKTSFAGSRATEHECLCLLHTPGEHNRNSPPEGNAALPGAVFLVSLRFYPLDLWTKYVRDIFLYYLNPTYPSIYIGNPLINFANFFWYVFTDPRIFQYFPIFLAPFFIALQAASLYLADIFELENVSIARGFIWSVALSGSEETIRVSQGGISEEDRHSPTFLIGGPGKVIVDLDSVAMFEKPDGTPHIIGSTAKEPRARATLDGF